MTDRVHSLNVVLERDMREDEVQTIIAAILALRGVIHVDTHVSTPVSLMAEMRAKELLRAKLWELLKP